MNKFVLRTRFIQFVFKVLSWVTLSFIGKWPRLPGPFTALFLKLDTVLKTRGKLELIKYTKGLRTCLLAYLSGSPVKVDGIKCNKDGLPRVLSVLMHENRGCELPTETLQVLTTILWCTRALKAKGRYCLKTISQPASVQVPSDFGIYLTDFWRSLGCYPSKSRVPKHLRWKSYHLSTKAGPSGHAIWSSLGDLSLIMRDEKLLSSIKALGGDEFSSKFETLQEALELGVLEGVLPTKPKKECLRRIAIFPDKEDKIRVVAILDYFSQTVLRPLHSYLYRKLRRIPQDRTFDQGAFKDSFKPVGKVYSADLTAATDRFPIEVQSTVLEGLLPQWYVSCWKYIMVGKPFDLPSGITDEGKTSISYQVGNPMGAYSSWAAFAITHHYVIYYCCRKLNIEWATLPYQILGDDIVIGNDIVAAEYRSLMLGFGVQISESKTHNSEHLYEFAKRLIYKGSEITPFPISALKESSKRNYLLVALLIETERKGFISRDGIPEALLSYYTYVRILPRNIRDRISKTSVICELMIKLMRGKVTAEDLLNETIRHYKYPFSHVGPNQSNGLISSLVVEAFADANPENDHITKKGKVIKPLGLLATNLVCFLTSPEQQIGKQGDLGFQLIYALPLLQVYGQIEEMYMNLKKQAIRLDRMGENWPLLLRAVTIPISDSVFTERGAHQVSRAAATFASKLLERLDLIQMYKMVFPDPGEG